MSGNADSLITSPRTTSSEVSRVAESLDLALVALEGPGSLVAIGREGRLMRLISGGAVHVELAAVDETVLALVDLAMARRKNITVVYPAPAGEVSVLLAGEILLRRLVAQEDSQAVGILTADTAQATRTWEQLAISSLGSRAPINDVFPAIRSGPNGENPCSRLFKGAIIGSRFGAWPVDVAVVDHLSGTIAGSPMMPTVRLFADPLDRELEQLAAAGELVWGWTEPDLALLTKANRDHPGAIPFSVAAERLETMGSGVKTTIHVAHHPEMETTVRRLREDLHLLSTLAGQSPPPGILKGIRVAWHHVSTLVSLPCRPSVFDRNAGLPPAAARATCTFEPEIAAWAKTLTGDLRELAEILASDLSDLRNFLEGSDPFQRELSNAIAEGPEALVVVRTQTAARAFIESVGGDPSAGRAGRARVVALRRLHREGTYSQAFFVGRPAPWDWHRIESGLSPDVHVLVLGDLDAYLGRKTLEALHRARARWGAREVRERVWRELVGGDPPLTPAVPVVRTEVVVTDALEVIPEPDPFEALVPLLDSTSLAVGDEGVEESVGEQTAGGEWRGAVEAVEVVTDAGNFLIPRDRLVDIRTDAEIVECRAAELRLGMILLVDRRGGRIGLLEAVADRLKKVRPDLLAANLLILDLQGTIRRGFSASGLTRSALFDRLVALGFEKTRQAAAGYVDEDGPLAPRDFPDLQRLNDALNLGMAGKRLQEAFAGVRRWRAFKRAAGRALVAASRDSLLTSETTRVDSETGLSIADLREMVLEARVREIRACEQPVPLAELGYVPPAGREVGDR